MCVFVRQISVPQALKDLRKKYLHRYKHAYMHIDNLPPNLTESRQQLGTLTAQQEGLAATSVRLNSLKDNEKLLQTALNAGHAALSERIAGQDATLAGQGLKLGQQKKLINDALMRQQDGQKELVKAVMSGLEEILTKQVCVWVWVCGCVCVCVCKCVCACVRACVRLCGCGCGCGCGCVCGCGCLCVMNQVRTNSEVSMCMCMMMVSMYACMCPCVY
jgi:hypothetical protein